MIKGGLFTEGNRDFVLMRREGAYAIILQIIAFDYAAVNQMKGRILMKKIVMTFVVLGASCAAYAGTASDQLGDLTAVGTVSAVEVPAVPVAKYLPPLGVRSYAEEGFTSKVRVLNVLDTMIKVMRGMGIELVDLPDSGIFSSITDVVTTHPATDTTPAYEEHTSVTSYGFKIDYKGEKIVREEKDWLYIDKDEQAINTMKLLRKNGAGIVGSSYSESHDSFYVAYLRFISKPGLVVIESDWGISKTQAQAWIDSNLAKLAKENKEVAYSRLANWTSAGKPLGKGTIVYIDAKP